jgi:hypothetical protein
VDQAVVAFGKHLEEPAIDCGAFLLPPEVFGCQRQAAAEGDHSLAGAVTRLAQTRPLRAVDLPAGCWWQDIDTPKDAKAARTALRRSLGKEADGPVSRLLNRPLSTRLSMAMAPLRPPPDLVSLVAFAFGLAGAALLAAGQGLAGGLPVHASSVTDGVDGEVARLQLRVGRGGAAGWAAGPAGDAAILAGAGLWALDGHDDREVLALTVAATTGALLSMAPRTGQPPWGCRRRPSGRWGGCWAAGMGGCCWSPWPRSWAHRPRPWPQSRPPQRCRWACESPWCAARRPDSPTTSLRTGVRPASGGQLRRGQAARRLRGSSATSSVRDLHGPFLKELHGVEDRERCVRNARSVAVDGWIGGHDPPRFPGGLPGHYGHRLLPVCCPAGSPSECSSCPG